ncbi:MAG: hypothetical protein KME03_18440 [Aphanocapsa lilacina HA4352-LM1]|jgi:hypothetical protein|nr:hypothetical protein [Aphanocapsa lilacina HA4352-LM1]
MFGLDKLKQTRYFQDVQADTLRDMILMLIEHKFGPVPERLARRLEEITNTNSSGLQSNALQANREGSRQPVLGFCAVL